MPAASLDDLVAQLRAQYPQPNVIPGSNPNANRFRGGGGGNNGFNWLGGSTAALTSGNPLAALSGLFGGGGGSNSNPFQYTRPFQPSPFPQPGTPYFDPASGYFSGLSIPGQSDLQFPNAYNQSTTEKDINAVARGLIRTVPSIANLINAQIAPNELAQLQASTLVSPEYANLQRDIYSGNALAAANSDKNVLLGPGADIISIANRLQQQVDPEFYTTRTATASGIQDLLKQGLTPGETEAIQRSLNQQNSRGGVLNVPTTSQTVANAATFGSAARDRLSQAVTQATQFLPASKSGVDVLQQGIKSPSSVSGAFSNVRQDSGQQPYGLGGQALGSASGIQNAVTGGQFGVQQAQVGQPAQWQKILGSIPDY